MAAVLCILSGIATPSYGQNIYAGHVIKSSDTRAITALVNNNEKEVAGVSSNFSTLFPNATRQKWSQRGRYSFVSFLNNGNRATACFSPGGALNYVITECDPGQLPGAFRKRIKKSYAGYRFLQATEIQAYGETAYQAIMENATGFITLKYAAGSVEPIQTVKK